MEHINNAGNSTEDLFLEFRQATIRRFDQLVFRHTCWTIRRGEQWAIVGGNAAGKTVLLQAIAGKYPVVEGNIRYHFYEQWQQRHPGNRHIYFTHLIAFVNFNAASVLHRHPDMYYQQRFHATETQGAISVKDFLIEHCRSLPAYAGKETTIAPEITALAEKLGVAYLLDRSVNKLSNGESKKLMIVQALLQKPELLLLDYPFTGLDVAARKLLQALLERIASQGMMIIIATMPDEIPPSVTHVAQVEALRLKQLFTRDEFVSRTDSEPLFTSTKPLPAKYHIAAAPAFTFAVKMENVQVQYEDVRILDHINWEVRHGERWALSGHNGSGKSTLLSLITADNPQAYANDLYLFDRRRGSGESIWDIKRMIGYISPELHLYYQQDVSCFAIVYSGLSETIGLPSTMNESLFPLVNDYMEMLDIAYLRDRSFLKISSGEQRMVLLARALVKTPPLLVMDEPCQGLDLYHRSKIKWITNEICRYQQKTLIYVTHYREEIPDCVQYMLQLHEGKIAYCGALK